MPLADVYAMKLTAARDAVNLQAQQVNKQVVVTATIAKLANGDYRLTVVTIEMP